MTPTAQPRRAGAGDGSAEPDAAASYEHARDELAAVVAKLESGGLSLDESLALWERGEHLAAVCTRFLDGARERVETRAATIRRSRPRIAPHLPSIGSPRTAPVPLPLPAGTRREIARRAEIAACRETVPRREVDAFRYAPSGVVPHHLATCIEFCIVR